ncbi:MAG: 4-hydroxy-tetrahydrodipicolinate reductase [Aquificaceae bacterium]|nr:4-hydroxy-tetrahydrodipicolinate reductase [Aquificaceae bacterium]MDW8237252.1 4-hydroxy-tetrahydrodipicolinate reductase [Aquificaceae bacterium]
MKTIKFALCGGLGRMGKAISSLCAQSPEFLPILVEHPSKASEGICTDLSEVINNVELVVDFAGSSEATLEFVKISAESKKPIIIGTTGHSKDQLSQIESFALKIPILIAPNMSLGVNLLFKLARIACKSLRERGFDAEILEIHHRHKKDAPSGTALRLESIVLESLGLNKAVHSRFGIAPRHDDEVSTLALRGGDVIGEHTLFLFGQGERLELTHRASSRDIFARGCLEAIRWIKDKSPGLYSMEDVLEV